MRTDVKTLYGKKSGSMKTYNTFHIIFCFLFIASWLIVTACSRGDIIITDAENLEILERENAALKETISQLEAAIYLLETAAYDPKQANPVQEPAVFTVMACEDACTVMVLPALWAEASGGGTFILQ